MRPKAGILILVTLAAVLTFNIPSADAVPVLLSDLITNNGTIQQGDKLFSNFSSSLPISVVVNTVEGTTVGGEHGLIIANDSLNIPAGSTGGSTIGFRVTVLDPNFLIDDYTSSLTGIPTGSGSTQLTSVVEDLSGNLLGTGTLSSAGPFSTHVLLSSAHSSINFEGTSVIIGPQSSPLTVAITFSQVPVSQAAVPEPSTWLLLGTGLAGLAAWRRKKAELTTRIKSV